MNNSMSEGKGLSFSPLSHIFSQSLLEGVHGGALICTHKSQRICCVIKNPALHIYQTNQYCIILSSYKDERVELMQVLENRGRVGFRHSSIILGALCS